ncbi:MAG: hypothetical protein KAS32_18450 [Candidatus Peribacteraceae bacterium]|nr:hypothetical protein [Candidatus Peribacteraceae bacterium]
MFTPQLYNIKNTQMVVNEYTIQAPAGDTPFETQRITPEDIIAKVGSKGDFTFVVQPDKSGRFICRVKQNSSDDVKEIHALAEAKAIFPCKLIGTSAHEEKATAQYAMVERVPEIVFNSADEAELEFAIITGAMVRTRK